MCDCILARSVDFSSRVFLYSAISNIGINNNDKIKKKIITNTAITIDTLKSTMYINVFKREQLLVGKFTDSFSGFIFTLAIGVYRYFIDNSFLNNCPIGA